MSDSNTQPDPTEGGEGPAGHVSAEPMMDNHARARVRAEAAERWLARSHPSLPVMEQAELVEAFRAGAEWAEDDCATIHFAEQCDWVVERAEGQRQLDEAGALIRLAADHLTADYVAMTERMAEDASNHGHLREGDGVRPATASTCLTG